MKLLSCCSVFMVLSLCLQAHAASPAQDSKMKDSTVKSKGSLSASSPSSDTVHSKGFSIAKTTVEKRIRGFIGSTGFSSDEDAQGTHLVISMIVSTPNNTFDITPITIESVINKGTSVDKKSIGLLAVGSVCSDETRVFQFIAKPWKEFYYQKPVSMKCHGLPVLTLEKKSYDAPLIARGTSARFSLLLAAWVPRDRLNGEFRLKARGASERIILEKSGK